jgi:hypothetical protein
VCKGVSVCLDAVVDLVQHLKIVVQLKAKRLPPPQNSFI